MDTLAPGDDRQGKGRGALKAALVTGGARRIGRAICLALASRGYDVAVHYNRTAPGDVMGEVRAMGRDSEGFRCDFGDVESVEGLVRRVRGWRPGLEVLVNSASIFERGPIVETEAGLFDRHIAINLRAPLLLTREFARLCGKGCIVNIVDSKVAGTGSAYAAYLLSKKALAELTAMAARELAPGIRVNAVAPGLILPPPGEGDEYLEAMAAGVPLARTGSPRDVAEAVTSLIENEYVTGQVIYVDGGEHLL